MTKKIKGFWLAQFVVCSPKIKISQSGQFHFPIFVFSPSIVQI